MDSSLRRNLVKFRTPLLLLSLTCLLSSCSLTIGGDHSGQQSFSSSPKSEETSSSEEKGTSSSSSGSSHQESTSEESSSSSVSSSDGSSSSAITVTKTISCYGYCLDLNDPISNIKVLNFSNADGVPYIGLTDFFKMSSFFILGQDGEGNDIPLFEVEGKTVTNFYTEATMTFDVENNLISTSDLESFLYYSGNQNFPTDVFSATSDPLASLSEDSSFDKGHTVTFNMSRYNAKLLSYGEDIYLPFAYLEAIVWNAIGYGIVFNGSDFYVTESSYVYSGDGLTSYGRNLYSGPYSQQKNRTEAYALYNYYSFVFRMENFYGKWSELGISSLDAKLSSMNLKGKMCSTISSTADAAFASAINQIFGDGGHTAFHHRGIGTAYNSAVDNSLAQQIKTYDSRYAETLNLKTALLEDRERHGNDQEGLYVSGHTAVIRFDSFDLNSSGNSPTASDVANDTQSTFAIFYKAFKSIKSNPNIENVVFDVSLNGGGYATALGQALSFLTNDHVKINYTNPLCGAVYQECADYDNDFDGDYSEDDSYEGKYDFYILTSAYSFSCANAFPCIAKEYGYAKIIGEKSGGGDCVVATGVSAEGTSWQMSGNTKLIHEDGSSFDEGASPDYELDYSYFSDFARLDAYLCSL